MRKNDDYCEDCGNHLESCICEQCMRCKNFFSLHKLYILYPLVLCENCMDKERPATIKRRMRDEN
jgi:recombinational DNA repair protein (RecF pathway)